MSGAMLSNSTKSVSESKAKVDTCSSEFYVRRNTAVYDRILHTLARAQAWRAPSDAFWRILPKEAEVPVRQNGIKRTLFVGTESVNMDAERLISLVYEREALWNPSDSRYHSRDVSRKLWQEISDEMGETCQNVKSKWQNLRDTYRKEYKKETASGGGASNVKKWKYSTLMSFLNDTLPLRQSTTNLQISEDDQSMFIPVSVDISSPLSPGSASQTFPLAVSPLCNITPSTSTSTCTSDIKLAAISAERKKRRMNEEEEAIEKLIRLEEERMEKIKRMSLRKGEHDDEDYHFLMSLLPHMRNLPGRLKLKTRSKMQNIVLEALDELETD